jgi:hypothetical protein
MQSLIDFVLGIIRYVIPFWPVFPWEGGVRTTGIPFGFSIDRESYWRPVLRLTGPRMFWKPVGPGLHPKWPLLGAIHTVNVKRQTVRTPAQPVRTQDGYELVLSAVITLSIDDVVKVWVDVHDYEGAIQERAMCFLAEYVNENVLADCSVKKINKSLRSRIKREAERWGCAVEQFGVVVLAESRVFHLFGNAGNGNIGATLDYMEM